MIGKSIGPYEVIGSLGRGGMGEVYRARDSRLGRDVALKILPPEFAGDAERLARFQREARMLAALQHQNIAAIYGLEELDGHPVLVMELADGDDLSVRLGGGALPVDEVQKIAAQLAAGLEYAHEQGVVHRDLKPANIKVAPGGRVKILDFGLARALEGPRGASSTMAAAIDDTVTRTRDLTGVGAVMGTAAYMSPEQTRGYSVDRRADIWAFGVIVFEMLTGQRLFGSETASDTLAAVLRKDPDWALVPADAAPVLTQICRRCLEKDPQLRLRDVGEARIALEGSSSSMMSLRTELLGPPPALAPAGRTGRLPLVIAAVAIVAALAVGWLGYSGRLGPAPEAARLVRATVVLGEGQGLYLNPGNPGPPVISPDGRRLAFVVQDTSGAVMLGVRALDDELVRLIPGSNGASYPFWGPDSRRVGYFSNNGLSTVDVAGGGPVVPVCPTENAKGGSWSPGDEILFTPNHAAAIFKVDANGGTPVAVTDPEKDEAFRSHRFPHWLPDGKHFLYVAWHRANAVRANATDAALHVAAADGSLDRELMPVQTGASYVAGHVIYMHENNLMARPFDPGSLEFSGPPRPLVGDVLSIGAAHCGAFSVSDAGVLIFVGQAGSTGDARLVWATGQERDPVIDRAGGLLGFQVSPDGKRVAMSKVDDQLGSYDIWVHDIERALATRLTFAAESEMGPVWSPDGRWIAYVGEDGGNNSIYRQLAAGGGRPEQLARMDTDLMMDSYSPDGKTISFTRTGQDGGFSVWLQEVGGEPRIYRDVPYNMANSRISPDGRWISYVSNETGQAEVFVESLDPEGGRWRISGQGGSLPTWSPRGDKIYYLDTGGDVQATEIIKTDGGIAIGRTSVATSGVVSSFYPSYGVDPTGDRLLIQVPVQENLNNRIEIITGWQKLLAQRED